MCLAWNTYISSICSTSPQVYLRNTMIGNQNKEQSIFILTHNMRFLTSFIISFFCISIFVKDIGHAERHPPLHETNRVWQNKSSGIERDTCSSKFGLTEKRTESPAITWLHLPHCWMTAPYARTRARKVFRFFTTIYHFSWNLTFFSWLKAR